MAQQRMKARDKKVQKMTRDGLVEENLAENSTVRVSTRAGDMRLKRKNHLGSDERMGSSHQIQKSRDAPVRGKRKNRNFRGSKEDVGARDAIEQASDPTTSGTDRKKKQAEKFHTKEKNAGEGKLLEKERQLSVSRGDARKDETGGTKRPKQKKRLQFAQEETGAADQEKTAEAANGKGKAKARKVTMKEHSGKGRNVQHEPEIIGKKQSKLAFENEGKVAGTGKKITGVAAGAATSAIHRKIAESEDDNAAVKGLHDLELSAEGTGRLAKRRLARRSVRNTQRRNSKQRNTLLKKQIQKVRIKREYAKAKRAEQAVAAPKGTVDYIKKIGGKVTNFFKENRKVYIAIGVLITMMFLISTSLTSCSALFLHNLVDYSGASYMSTDEAIREADLYYTQLEADLQERVNQIEAENTGYDRYRYQIDEIGHDPFILISYLSAKHEIFEFDASIKAELNELFTQQYSLSTESSNETITETKRVRVGESLGQVVTSGYCNCSICCGQWSGGPTASGAMPQASHTIAVDAHTPTVPMGTKVVMNGVEYTVEDTGNFTQYGVDFDVYYDSHSAASAHGHQTWEAYLADDNGSQEIEVTTTTTESVYSVTLTNHSLMGVCQNRLGAFQKELFSAYNDTKGNLQMFESPFDFNWYYRISSYYGYRIHPISGANAMHNGVDIGAAEGTSIAAGLTGSVITSTYNDGYGNYVEIKDTKGYTIRYAHLSSRSVSVGQQVEKGEEIGKVGSTGNSTGPHLHLELFHNGERLNPVFYFETGDSIPGLGDVEYSSEAARRLVEYALQFQGTPYVWGGYSPSGFDCSGFVSYCLTNSGVLNTGHLTCDGLLDRMTRIPESEMQPGDIIFFQGTYNTPGASHVGIYIGNGQMVHSGSPNKISDIYSSYYQQHWLCVARW
ncbi:MAG: peptidoglycan DD-metalloendopeptidase family protein [Eubacteriales bacterium]|nr:peptidoglycan DD-metalloendopeptidase family protein [Eubacteriales bacterium]